MSPAQIASLLSRLGEGAVALAPKIPGTAGAVLGGVGAGVALVGDLLALNRDPVVHIDAIRDLDPALAKIRADREATRAAAVAAHATPTS